MKIHLFLAAAVLSFASVEAQGISEIMNSAYPKGVSVENKAENPEEDKEKTQLLKKVFEECLEKYTLSLNTDGHDLNKVIGLHARGVARGKLPFLSLTIQILPESDKLDIPTIYRVYSSRGVVEAFVLKIPRNFFENMKSEERFYHLAFHELAHIINDDVGGPPKGHDDLSFMEDERNVEYLVYTMVGPEKYVSFLEKFYDDDKSIQTSKDVYVRRILMWIGVWEK